MSEIFGSFVEQGNEKEFLLINFSPNSIPLQQRWRNNGLSADFLADYWSTFFPSEAGDSTVSKRLELKDAVGYIANELLENAMKFSYDPVQHPVSIGLYLHRNEMLFYVTNSIDPVTIKPFQQFISKLLSSDPLQLYLDQLEMNADEDTHGSHLGFLTMINDYNAELAWKFQSHGDGDAFTTVTTMVRLSL